MFGLYLPRTWSPQSHVQPLRRRLAVLSFSPDRKVFFFVASTAERARTEQNRQGSSNTACKPPHSGLSWYDSTRMTKLLEVAGLACHRGGRLVFDDLSFSLAKGELLVLTGPNGSGKTTLLRALALLVPAEAGTIQWQGADVGADREAWRAALGWLGHQEGLKGDLSV